MFSGLKNFLWGERNIIEAEQQQLQKSVVNDLVTSVDGDEENETVTESDKMTVEDIWNRGNNVLKSLEDNKIVITEDLTEFALEICKQTIPCLLTLAKEAPMVGPVAGVLLDFYVMYKEVGENRESFIVLEREMHKAMMWLYDSRELFVEDSELSKEGRAVIEEFKQFCLAVLEAKTFVQKAQQRFQSKNIVSTLKNWVMSKNDSDQLAALTTLVSKATESFKLGLPAHEALVRKKNESKAALKVKNKMDKAALELVCEFDTDSAVAEKAKLIVKGTRDWLFQEVDAWMIGETDTATVSSRLFWLQATAGMGKTVFTAALSERLRQRGQLLGIYMFQFNDQSKSNATFVFRMLSRQMASNHKELRENIVDAANKLKGDTRREDPMTVFTKLIAEPLQGFEPKPKLPMMFVLDALDEIGVEGSSNRKELLDMLTNKNYFLKLPSWVKIFVSGRPEEDIVKKFSSKKVTNSKKAGSKDKAIDTKEKLEEFTHIIKEKDPRHTADLQKYLEYSLREIGIIDDSDTLVQLLLGKSDGRFIYTAMVAAELVGWLNEEKNISARNSRLLDKAAIEEIIESLPEGINGCYEKSFKKLYCKQQSSSSIDGGLVRQFCQLMVASMAPLPVSMVREFLGLTTKKDLKNFHALKEGVSMMFPMREGDNQVARFYPLHKSVRDRLAAR